MIKIAKKSHKKGFLLPVLFKSTTFFLML